MADDLATLRDTTVIDSKPEPETKPAAESELELKVPQIVAEPTAETAEIARIIEQSGMTKDQLNDLLAAPKVLESMRYQIQNDPKEFLRQLERSDPKTVERFFESMAEEYLSRFGEKKTPSGKSETAKDESQNELMRQVEQLREQTTRLLTKDQQREQAASLAAVRQRYESRVDDLLGLKEVKEMNLTPSEVKNLRARLNLELSADQTAVQRVNSGNFVDVPRVFQSLLQEKVDDRKAATDAEKKGRERVNSNAFWEFPNGPDAAFLGDLNKAIADDNDPNWGGTVDAYAKALERTR